jgi:hypothetical protein
MCGIMLHVSIREERRKEVAMLKQLELDSLIPNLSDLCIPALMSLGVSPNEWKPLTFLNEGHYNELLKTNSVGDELAKRLEAYKVVSLGGK